MSHWKFNPEQDTPITLIEFHTWAKAAGACYIWRWLIANSITRTPRQHLTTFLKEIGPNQEDGFAWLIARSHHLGHQADADDIKKVYIAYHLAREAADRHYRHQIDTLDAQAGDYDPLAYSERWAAIRGECRVAYGLAFKQSKQQLLVAVANMVAVERQRRKNALAARRA